MATPYDMNLGSPLQQIATPDPEDDATESDAADLGVYTPELLRVLTSSTKRTSEARAPVTAAMQAQRDQYQKLADTLRQQRVGPSKTDALVDWAAAFAKPTESGQFGEAIGNGLEALNASNKKTRTEQAARDDLLAKYDLGLVGLDVDAAKLGYKNVSDDETAATKLAMYAAKANAPLKPTKLVFDSANQGRDPWTGAVRADPLGNPRDQLGTPSAPSIGSAPAPVVDPTGALGLPPMVAVAPTTTPRGAARGFAQIKTPLLTGTGKELLETYGADQLAAHGITNLDPRVNYTADAVKGGATKENTYEEVTGDEAYRHGYESVTINRKDGSTQGDESRRLPSLQAMEDSTRTISEAVSKAQEMKTLAKNLRLTTKPFDAAAVGALAQFLPGSHAMAIRNQITTLTGKIATEVLTSMRDASKTGASGFGQLTGPELDLLKAAIVKVDQATDYKTLMAAYDEVIQHYERAITKLDGQGKMNEYARRVMAAGTGAATAYNPPPGAKAAYGASVAAKSPKVRYYGVDGKKIGGD